MYNDKITSNYATILSHSFKMRIWFTEDLVKI